VGVDQKVSLIIPGTTIKVCLLFISPAVTDVYPNCPAISVYGQAAIRSPDPALTFKFLLQVYCIFLRKKV